MMKHTVLFFILAILLCIINSCSKLDDPAASIPIDSIIELMSYTENSTITTNQVLADSNSFLIIEAVLGEKTTPNQTVVFSTSEGLLTLPGQPISQGSKSVSVKASYRNAVAILHSSLKESKNVMVSASITNFSNNINLEFRKAYPEYLNINPVVVTSGVSDSININLDVFRSNGLVSNNIVFNISAIEPDSIPLNLPNYGILQEQKGNFQIVNPLGKMGTAFVQVTVSTSKTNTISRIIEIRYI